MRRIFIYIFLTLASVNLYAQEVQADSLEISTLISQIKSARSSDRRLLMNQLKIQLRELNAENRAKVMQELRASFGAKSHSKGMGMGMGRQSGTQKSQKQNKRHNNSQNKGKR